MRRLHVVVSKAQARSVRSHKATRSADLPFSPSQRDMAPGSMTNKSIHVMAQMSKILSDALTTLDTTPGSSTGQL